MSPAHPNRSRRKDAPGRNPKPDEIRKVRQMHGLSQTGAAALVYSTMRSWQNWEAGDRRMHPAIWAYFRIVAGEARDAKRAHQHATGEPLSESELIARTLRP